MDYEILRQLSWSLGIMSAGLILLVFWLREAWYVISAKTLFGIASSCLVIGLATLQATHDYPRAKLLDGLAQNLVRQTVIPQTLPSGEVVSSVQWDGVRLTHLYEMPEGNQPPAPEAVVTTACSQPTTISALALGIELVHSYRYATGESADVNVSVLSCFAE